MRTFVLDRESMLTSQIALPGGALIPLDNVIAILDRLGLPDGFPFVTDDDGSPAGCSSINSYLYEAWKQRGLDLRSMRDFHVYNLARLLRFVRGERVKIRAAELGMSAESLLGGVGELKIDLIETTRSELLKYKESRSGIAGSTLATELGCISAFFWFAKEAGWIVSDPVPRWGKDQRNTLMPQIRRRRSPKFLTTRQTRHFLEVGLRGDGTASHEAPAYPERDYSFGLLLANTGMRREEAANLLDCELLRVSNFPADGLHSFDRLGKYNKIRTIYFPQEAAGAVDLYRDTERAEVVNRAQPRLRKLLESGRLDLVSLLPGHQGGFTCRVGGEVMPVEFLPNERRRNAVQIEDDGTIQPLALFLGRGGLPVTLAYWDDLFVDARARVSLGDSLDVPPNHIKVVPHTMRHTFAVRMLAALMREGRSRQNDPYAFLTNPLLTIMQLLGHSNIETTLDYLYAAERWTEEFPNALRLSAMRLLTPQPTSRKAATQLASS